MVYLWVPTACLTRCSRETSSPTRSRPLWADRYQRYSILEALLSFSLSFLRILFLILFPFPPSPFLLLFFPSFPYFSSTYFSFVSEFRLHFYFLFEFSSCHLALIMYKLVVRCFGGHSWLRQEHARLSHRHGTPQPPRYHGLRRHHPSGLLGELPPAGHRLRLPVVWREDVRPNH